MEGGHIGVVASMIALVQGGVDVSTYGSTKAALYSYVNSFRQELIAENRNVTISMGCPYMIRTGMFLGFKTKLDFLFRPLEPDYVGKRLIKEFIQKKQVCHLYLYEAVLFKLFNLFPS
jgi:all-trans-retinol dehydrogenase (NAD+)